MTEKQKCMLTDALKRPASVMLTGAAGDLLPAAFFMAGKLLEVEPELLHSHPDFYMLSTAEQKMGVEEAMLLVKRASLKAVKAEKTIIIVDGFDKFSEAAQNKLLLTIEEGNALFLITVYTNRVLETVKSRLRNLTLPKSVKEDFQIEDGDFLYVLTQGCLSDVEKKKKYLPLSKKLAACIERKDFLEIFQTLHLVKEKDTENFYEKEGLEGVNVLYHFYSYLFSKWLVYLMTGIQECSFCKFGDTEDIQAVIQYAKHINEHAAMLSSKQYTKEHFFLLFAEALCIFEQEGL